MECKKIFANDATDNRLIHKIYKQLIQINSQKKKKKKKPKNQSSRCDSAVMNLSSIHEDTGLIPGLNKWVKDLALP